MEEGVLDESLAAALSAGSDACGRLLTPVTSQAFALPVLSPGYAASVAQELRTNKPSHSRSRLELTSAHYPMASRAVGMLQSSVLPVLAAQLEPAGRAICPTCRAYALRYASAGLPDGGRTARVHVDDCDVTLAVCLGAADTEWSGADLCYIDAPADGRPRASTPDPTDPTVGVARHVHSCGVGVLHGGEAYHYVEPLLSGERFTLVVQAMWDDGATWKRDFLGMRDANIGIL